MLKKHFIGKGEVKGFIFQQVYRDSQWYIYQVNSDWYEVFLRRTLNGKEIYPRSRQFGKTAWYLTSLDKALSKIIDFKKSVPLVKDTSVIAKSKKSRALPKTVGKNRRSNGAIQHTLKTL